MSPIRFQPEEVRDAGLAFVAAGDDLIAGAGAIRGAAMPPMPVEVSAKVQADLAAAALRLEEIGRLDARLGQDLQIRAEAALMADATVGGANGDGHALKSALSSSVEVLGAAGTSVLATISIAGGKVSATGSSGLKVLTSLKDLGVEDYSKTDDGARREGDENHSKGERHAGDQQRADGSGAPAPSAAAPQGGPAAATLGEALAMDSGAEIDTATGEGVLGDQMDLRATEHDGGGQPPAQQPMPATTGEADRQDWGCWMAGQAAHAGLPPALPLMVALARSGMHNLPADGSSSGFFGIDSSQAYAPAGHGLPRDAQPDASWWADSPDAQLDHVLRKLGDAGGGVREGGLSDSEALGRWATDADLGADPAQFADASDAANAMVEQCREAGGSPAGSGSALAAARGQLGVHEVGVNAGPQVDRFLGAADVPSGNPWCAGFVTWSLEQSGHEMPGSGWAAVSNWVDSAQSGQHGLSIVDASDARPGDIVAYDWGGGGDYGSDGHIGFLDSDISDGRFTTVEGNTGDAVSRMERSVDRGNAVFIRVNG